MLRSARYLLVLVFNQSYFLVHLISRTWPAQDFKLQPCRRRERCGSRKNLLLVNNGRKEAARDQSVSLRLAPH